MKTYYKTAPRLIKSSISIALLNTNYTQIDKVRPSLYFLSIINYSLTMRNW